eukprot:CAMPEP_0197413838 /NCGR_PEP_ID=MMETSP1170-20131217/651_1 /TAXON_ID=54406 /ORGANISM="Sarcinochrysis sp, Strain CCMP770" /LENGTH=84 /DNA_ID=CAMNT_0042940481 /DNA_START=328 /DNA_END=582 /DNA_ORIENTATION=-
MYRDLSSLQYARYVAQQGPAERLQALVHALKKDEPLFEDILTALARNVAPTTPTKRRPRDGSDDHPGRALHHHMKKRFKAPCCA